MEEVLVPLAFPCFVLCLLRVDREASGVFRLPGEGGDHFHCTVEPSSGHIRCRSGNASFLRNGSREVPPRAGHGIASSTEGISDFCGL